jgi:hypothetical protein
LYLFSADSCLLIMLLSDKCFVFSYFCLDFHSPNAADYTLVGFESSPALALAKPEWLPH